jgi:uncharacterized protein
MFGGIFMKANLHEPVFYPLAMKEIQPEGWLRNQLKIQATGLSGNLDKFWTDIKDSKWIGGKEDGWERVPYWLDGFIPLAWLLEDEDMKARANYYVNYIIEHQSSDGWICPEADTDRSKYDMWALFLLLKVLVVYHDATGDERIEGVVNKALKALDRHIDHCTLFNWAHTRWFEAFISILWLYERTGAEWLLHLASKIQSQGFNWQEFFKRWPYKKSDGKGRWSQMSHVVNNAMMLKSGVLLWRVSGSKEHLDSAEHMVKLFDEYHGTVTGIFTGDECLAGTSPVQGTELCAVAEYMYSLEHLLAISGQSHWGDRLEKIAYNALPATFSPDMWTHQYDQQVNQVECSKQKDTIFNTNSGESNLFGLEPNFGCCTANLSQAWPKLALSTFMKSSEGLAVTVYAPSKVITEINGVRVSVSMETDYPFKDTIQFKVKTDKEVKFPIWLRIPEWTKNAEIIIKDGLIKPESGTFYKLEEQWQGEMEFTLRIPMEATLAQRPNNLCAVTRGPLVYSLAIKERWERINQGMHGREFPHCDYEIYAESPWNYGLCIDKSSPRVNVEFEERPVGNFPFSPEGSPVVAYTEGRKVDWSVTEGVAAPYPEMKWVSDEVEKIKLIPYGCTNLRVTEMPLV